MDIKTKAIVMGSSSKGESDKKVKLFSVDLGVIDATVRGVKKQGAKLAACTFSFALVEVILVQKNGFYTVTSVDLIEPFQELSQDLENFEFASAALEILNELSRGQDNVGVMFVELLTLFKLLSFSDDSDKKLVFSKWIIDMLGEAGYKLNLSRCLVCGNSAENSNKLYIDVESGSVYCDMHKPVNGIMSEITPGVFKVIYGFDKVSLSDMRGRVIKDGTLKSDDVFNILISLIQGVTGKKLKSILTF